jgi:hypothetical protein
VKGSAMGAEDFAPGFTLADPTQMAFDGRRLLVVSNSGWEAIGKPSATRRKGATIIEIALPNGCKG